MSERIFTAGNGFPAIDPAATGRNIERLRIAAGRSVRDLQAALGFASPRAIYKWREGQALPTLDNMVILAVLLGRPMEEIIVTSSARKEGKSNGRE